MKCGGQKLNKQNEILYKKMNSTSKEMFRNDMRAVEEVSKARLLTWTHKSS